MGKKKSKKLKLPYAARSDAEKIRSQWKKITGLHERNEPSAAIVRAATAAELAVNLAIRAEFAAQSELSPETIDAMLRKSNGLWGKMGGLLLPLIIGSENEVAIKKLCKISEQINKDRNEIAHSGKFSKRSDALKSIERCRTFCNSLVQCYEHDFDLSAIDAESLEVDPVADIQASVMDKKPRSKR